MRSTTFSLRASGPRIAFLMRVTETEVPPLYSIREKLFECNLKVEIVVAAAAVVVVSSKTVVIVFIGRPLGTPVVLHTHTHTRNRRLICRPRASFIPNLTMQRFFLPSFLLSAISNTKKIPRKTLEKDTFFSPSSFLATFEYLARKRPKDNQAVL